MEDRIARAEAGGDRSTREALYLDAAGAVETLYDARILLAAVCAEAPSLRSLLEALCARVLAFALHERTVWAYRDVARVRLEVLGDRAGAAAALDEGARALEARSDAPAFGYEWAIVAAGFRETLGDAARARECLALGVRQVRAARGADDPHALVDELVRIGARDEARALVDEVDAFAAQGLPVSAWGLANSYDALEAPERAAQVLARAVAQSEDPRALVHLAHASQLRADEAGVAEALARARAVARDAEAWLAIAKGAHEMNLGAAEVRAALVEAEARLGTDREAREGVSSAYARWLGDEEASRRVGPRGVRPGGEGATARAGLFDWLRARVTDEELTAIAEGDYGADAREHRAALDDLRRTGLLPTRLRWVPHEVLQLARWSEGERVQHVARAFACVVLCLAPDDSDERVTNGVILAESCVALGPEALTRAVAMFAALGDEGEGEGEGENESPVERAAACELAWLLATIAGAPRERCDALDETRRTCEAIADGSLDEAIASSQRAATWRWLRARAAAARPDGAGEKTRVDDR